MGWLIGTIVALTAALFYLLWRQAEDYRLARAAGYAGYSKEDLAAERFPTCRELREGVMKQPEKLQRRIDFFMPQLSAAFPQEEIQFLVGVQSKLTAFIEAVDADVFDKEQVKELAMIYNQTLLLAGRCPSSISRGVFQWAREFSKFVSVVGTLLSTWSTECDCPSGRG